MDLFFLFCYVLTLLTAVNSYVLLAANLEDFRTIAKKFVPENLADQIVELAQGSGMNPPSKDGDTAEYSEESQQRHVDHSYEMTTEGDRERRYKHMAPPRNAPRFEMKIAPPAVPAAPAPVAAPVAPVAAAPLMSLDEIVEKVKQRLQTELLNRGPLAAAPSRNVKLAARIAPEQNPVYDYKSPVNEDQEDIQYEEDNYGKQETQNPLRMQRIVDRNKPVLTKNVYMNPHQGVIVPVAGQKNVRYAPQVTIRPNIQQQSMMQQQRPQPKMIGIKQKILKKKQMIRLQSSQPLIQVTSTKKKIEETTQDNNVGIFEAVDMLKSNDSYEDYVTPPKEEAFESETEEPVKFVPVVITLKPALTIRTTTASTAAVEPLAEVAGSNGAQLAMEYEYETPEVTTEPKAKTESISYEEKETKPDPNITTTAEAKGKVTKKSKMGTMIPTREFYKLSSPNYYAKLPTIAEKYNFNEPIPEKDREPENLKPIGNPPASINGKVALLK